MPSRIGNSPGSSPRRRPASRARSTSAGMRPRPAAGDRRSPGHGRDVPRGGVAVWRCGGVAVWRCGGVAVDVPRGCGSATSGLLMGDQDLTVCRTATSELAAQCQFCSAAACRAPGGFLGGPAAIRVATRPGPGLTRSIKPKTFSRSRAAAHGGDGADRCGIPVVWGLHNAPCFVVTRVLRWHKLFWRVGARQEACLLLALSEVGLQSVRRVDGTTKERHILR